MEALWNVYHLYPYLYACMLNLDYNNSIRMNQEGGQLMERFVLAGKAKTVFQLIELMAKGEKAKKAEEKKNKK